MAIYKKYYIYYDWRQWFPEWVMWNPWNKVVESHKDGTIYAILTDIEREKRGLPVPWEPSMAVTEIREPPIF